MRTSMIAIASGAMIGCGFAVLSTPQAYAEAADCDHPTIVGTMGPDDLVGTDGPDVIDGLAGQDTLHGMGGDDVLCGGSGADQLLGGSGNDVLRGEQDHLVTGGRATHLDGDTLTGGAGDDVLLGGFDSREAEIHGGDALDFPGAQHGVVVDLAAGTAHGQGDDTIGPDQWRVIGTPYDDVIRGSWRDEYVEGGRGRDSLHNEANRLPNARMTCLRFEDLESAGPYC